MTAKTTGPNRHDPSTQRTETPPAAASDDMSHTPMTATQAAQQGRPGPWDQPWRHKEDATGWETVYRGTGQRREVGISVVLDLTPRQNQWLRRATKETGLSLHDFLSKMIEDARVAAEAGQSPPPGLAGEDRET